MKNKIIRIIQSLFIIIGLVISSFFLNYRYTEEKKQDKYELSVSYRDIITYGKPDFFDNLVKFGFNDFISVIELEPKKCIDLELEGKLLVSTGIEIKNYINIQAVISPYIPEILKEAGIEDDYTYIYSENRELLDYLEERIRIENNSAYTEIYTKTIGYRKNQRDFFILVTDYSKRAIHDFYIEFDEEFIQYLRLSEFRISFDLTSIPEKRQLAFLKRHALMPDYVISDSISRELNSYLLLKNIRKVDFEFEKNNIPYPFLRGHWTKPDINLSKMDYIRRFRKSVIERKNVFLRYDFNNNMSMDDNYDNLRKIRADLHKYGYDPGPVYYFLSKEIKYGMFLKTISVFCICSFIFFSLRILFRKEKTSGFLLELIISFLASFYYYTTKGNISFTLFILFLLSVIIPLASLNLIRVTGRIRDWRYILKIFDNILELLTYNLTGVMLILPVVYNEMFLQGQIQFRGVKLSLMLPVFIFILYHLKKSGFDIYRFMEKEIKFKHAFIFTGFAGVLAYYVLRSSNAGADFMIPFEKDLRFFLEDFFIIRPRTKEFLMLYPSIMFFSIISDYRKLRFLYSALLFFILIGQTSIFNTYMHFHIPVHISVIRTLNGLILGVITGIILMMSMDLIRFTALNLRRTEK